MIEPLLMALGWDVSNPDNVRPEYRAKTNYNPVDYALMVWDKSSCSSRQKLPG